MQHLRHKEIDKIKWNEAIRKSENGKITHFTWYLDEVCPNWEALVNDDYSLIFPIPTKKKFIFKYLIQPFLIQQLGLIFQHRAYNCNVTFDDCLDFITKRYSLFNFNVNMDASYHGKIVTNLNNNLVLDLSESYDHIYNRYSTNLKRNLKKALSHNLTVCQVEHSDDIIFLFNEDKGKEVGWNKTKNRSLSKVLNVIEQNAEIINMHAYEDEHLICGAIFVGYDGRWTFLFSGNTQRGKETNAMPVIIDSFIKEKCEESEYLDFEGSNNEGLFRFYSSFGADNEKYTTIKSKMMNFLKHK